MPHLCIQTFQNYSLCIPEQMCFTTRPLPGERRRMEVTHFTHYVSAVYQGRVPALRRHGAPSSSSNQSVARCLDPLCAGRCVVKEGENSAPSAVCLCQWRSVGVALVWLARSCWCFATLTWLTVLAWEPLKTHVSNVKISHRTLISAVWGSSFWFVLIYMDADKLVFDEVLVVLWNVPMI